MTPRATQRVRAAVVLAATLLGVAATARLGVWQLSRAAEKQALQQALDSRAALPALPATQLARSADTAAAQHYRRISLRGRWLPNATLFLDNRQMSGRVGFVVVTPLQLAGSADAVIVQRGWVPRDAADRTRLPDVPTPIGEVNVSGHIAPPPPRLYEFAASASGVIRQNLDLGEFSRETGLSLRPVSIVQESVPNAAGMPDGLLQDGLRRDWPRPAANVERHHGYAFQWFALCALMSGLYVWFQLVRPRLRAHRQNAPHG